MTKDELLALRRRETPKTLRLLSLYPEEQRDLRPAEKSRTALEMSMLFLGEERVIQDLCTVGAPQMRPFDSRPQTIAEVIALLRDAFAAGDRALENADLTAPVDFYGTRLPLGDAAFIELLDHIHHRGQFTVYSRLAGARVPQIYGPSADEPAWG